MKQSMTQRRSIKWIVKKIYVKLNALDTTKQSMIERRFSKRSAKKFMLNF